MIMLYLEDVFREASVRKEGSEWEEGGKKEERDAARICQAGVNDEWADDAGGEVERMWDDGEQEMCTAIFLRVTGEERGEERKKL